MMRSSSTSGNDVFRLRWLMGSLCLLVSLAGTGLAAAQPHQPAAESLDAAFRVELTRLKAEAAAIARRCVKMSRRRGGRALR